ncbi:MAG: carboxypeptidase regulatory-like domain-containing protein, partial [Bryobacterales bacterium]|nr:carboxypeptidase regulatory-like domain-containing protein [Bryobacterales bacterium]
MNKSIILLLISLLLFATVGLVQGQVTTGTILGQVADNTGSAVQGATITISNTGQGVSKQLSTDDNGLYNVPFLIPGTYSVSVERAGFKKSLREGIIVQVDQKARVDVTLELGQVSETISVTAAASL